MFNNCLLSIFFEDLKYNNLDFIIASKFCPSISTCNCINKNDIMCTNINFRFINNPNFLFFVMDISKVNYFKNIMII